jgi:hypothetical protein
LRTAAQIGDSTIAWLDFGFIHNGFASDIVAFDRASVTVTRLTSDGQANQAPAISPDGKVITWEDCQGNNLGNPIGCDIWSATGGGGNWTLHQLTSGAGAGVFCVQPDTDGQIVVYACNRLGTFSIYWQPAGGGPEQVLSFFPGNGSTFPAVSRGVISFVGAEGEGINSNIFVFDTSTSNLFQVVNNPSENDEFSDISVTPDGKVRVVWQVQGIGINAFTFSLTVDESGISNLVGQLLNAGCIDNAGIAAALTSKLSAAQAAGDTQTAINILTALKKQIQAQSGKHVATSCTMAGEALNPVTVLLDEVQRLIDSLRVSITPAPITGSVVDATGVGVAGATVSIVDSVGNTVATAVTDITGFYFFATTGVLTSGANYTLAVSGLPAGFSTVTPLNQPFPWQGMAAAFSDFVLN